MGFSFFVVQIIKVCFVVLSAFILPMLFYLFKGSEAFNRAKQPGTISHLLFVLIGLYMITLSILLIRASGGFWN